MKFQNVKRDQIVLILPEKIRGKVIDLAPEKQEVCVQVDGMGAYHWVPARNLKFISESSADLANNANKKFEKEFVNEFKKTSKAFRKSSVQKKKKPKSE